MVESWTVGRMGQLHLSPNKILEFISLVDEAAIASYLLLNVLFAAMLFVF